MSNPVNMFLALFSVFFIMIALFNAMGFFNASIAVSESGNASQLVSVWTNGIYAIVGDVIFDAVISCVVSAILTVALLLVDDDQAWSM